MARRSWHSSSKSAKVQKWMFGVLYQVYGMKSETGMRPLVARYQRQRQWPKLGKVMMHWRPTRSISSRMRSGYSTACRA
ncbi:hypothetical protein D3C74_484940 [compost metagenome]